MVVGVFAFMLTSLVHYRWIRWGALPMYLAGIVFLIMTKFIGDQSLWSAQLAAFGTNQFSAGAACGRRRHHGVGAVPDPISRDASDTAITALRSDCGRSVSVHPDATRLGRGHHLGAGDARTVVRCRSAAALFDLRHSHRRSRLSRLPSISALNRTSNSGSPPLHIPTSTNRAPRGRSTNH